MIWRNEEVLETLRMVSSEHGDEWVLAAERNPSVQHFDNEIDFRHGLADLAPGRVHVTREQVEHESSQPDATPAR